MTDRPPMNAFDQDGTQAALTAFVRITEAATLDHDHVALAHLAIDVLHDLIPHADHAYNVLEDALWKNRAVTPHVPADLLAVMRSSMSVDTPQYVQLFREARPILSEWNAALARLPEASGYSSAGFFPLSHTGEPFAFLGMGITEPRPWSEGERLVFLAAGRALQLALDRAWHAQDKDRKIHALERRQHALEASAASRQDGTLERDPARLIDHAERALLSLLPGAAVQYWTRQEDAWHVQSQAGAAPDDRWDVLDSEPDSPLLNAPRQQARQQAVRVHGVVRGVLDVTLPGDHVWGGTARAVLETVATHLGLALERAEQGGVADTGAAVDEHARQDTGEAFHLGVWNDVSRQIEAQVGPHTTPHDLIVVRRLDRLLEDAELCRRPLRLGLVGLRLLVQDVQAGLPQARGVTWRLGELRPVRANREILRRVLYELMEHAVRGSGGDRLVEVWSGADHAHRVVSVRSRGEDRDSAVTASPGDGTWGPPGDGLTTVRRLVERHGGRVWVEIQPGVGVTVALTLPG